MTINGTSTYSCTGAGTTTSSTQKQKRTPRRLEARNRRPRGLGAGGETTIDVNNPPYAIHNGPYFNTRLPFPILLLTHAAAFGPLNSHTLATNATHAGEFIELDVHNLFGTLEARTTYNALKTLWPTRRPFIIGRSTFAGSGKWAGHWVSIVVAVVFLVL